MDSNQLMKEEWTLEFSASDYSVLHAHLFPGDHDEHGAVLAASMSMSAGGRNRLLVRRIFLAKDGVDFVESTRGYRKLRAQFVRDSIRKCIDEKLVYLAVHNHGGSDCVAFSHDDLASHERGYPALQDLSSGLPVGGVVFANNAVAGDIWLPDGRRVALDRGVVIGRARRVLRPKPQRSATHVDPEYDRQARMFGAQGQALLKEAKVAIVGLGGVGSHIAEYLGRLGVGKFVLIDPDRLEWSNLSRVLGSRRLDAFPRIAGGVDLPKWLVDLANRLHRHKVSIARRNILRANPSADIRLIKQDVCTMEAAQSLLDCDYIFLAADSMRARLLCNAVVHQHFIPCVQVGSKIQVDSAGHVSDVFSIVRPVFPGTGCLWCNQVINPAKLQDESLSDDARRAQNYGVGEDAPAPSVVTLNAVGASRAVNDFLMYMTGLAKDSADVEYVRFDARCGNVVPVRPRRDPDCPECSGRVYSRFGMGDHVGLPGVTKGSPRLDR